MPDPTYLQSNIKPTAPRRAVRPRDNWSGISQLPEEIAEQVRLERQIEIAPAVAFTDGYPEEGMQARFLSALDRLANIEATNPTASMLAIQLVNIHELYLDCHRRSVASTNNPLAFKSHMLNVERLSNLYMRQLAALDRHRGRGKQQVRVEHVHVSAGWQAIVGHLSIDDAERRSKQPSETDALGGSTGKS
ncbi:hypothetical protein [Tsuneonella deserti]|uniref:hypothetical protein n=1 Tax=Tsuneonella deserti TaxID=2035528 RepID=UPI00166757B9|nr:hypothetical protein [Tsuneonella deserti]